MEKIRKIALSAGHYRYTAGKRIPKKLDKNETREWVLNDRICDKIEKKLKVYEGYELLRTDDTTGEKAISVEDRAAEANKFGAEVYISVHHNAGIDGGKGGGIVAYTYTKIDKETEAWQKELYNSLIKHTGLKGNRAQPLARADLAECRLTAKPAKLLECGYLDSATDSKNILTEEYAEKCAEAIVEVLVKKLGLKKKPTEIVRNLTAEEFLKELNELGYSFTITRKEVKLWSF